MVCALQNGQIYIDPSQPVTGLDGKPGTAANIKLPAREHLTATGGKIPLSNSAFDLELDLLVVALVVSTRFLKNKYSASLEPRSSCATCTLCTFG